MSEQSKRHRLLEMLDGRWIPVSGIDEDLRPAFRVAHEDGQIKLEMKSDCRVSGLVSPDDALRHSDYHGLVMCSLSDKGRDVLDRYRIKEPKQKRRGRPPKGETGKAQIVLANLVRHHRWEPGLCLNYTPAKLKELADDCGTATVSRFLESKFGKPGHERYAGACGSEHIRQLIGEWLAEVNPRERQVRNGAPEIAPEDLKPIRHLRREG
jgi:hypothetical protein